MYDSTKPKNKITNVIYFYFVVSNRLVFITGLKLPPLVMKYCFVSLLRKMEIVTGFFC